MDTAYDVVAIGAGHHGLVAAAWMAKAGKKALVLEPDEISGGGRVTKEAAPGFLLDENSTVHQVILSNPRIKNDELQLQSRFRLEYIFPEVAFASLFDGGSILPSCFSVDDTARAIAEKDDLIPAFETTAGEWASVGRTSI